jgi:hypothetical protein
MRQGLQEALQTSPVQSADVAYPTGSIVVCYACGKPLYRLQANIYVGEKPSRSAWKYAPITVADLQTLTARMDLDAGIRASIKFMSAEDQRTHCEQIPTLKAGSFLDCPSCTKPFVFARTSSTAEGKAEFTDRAFVIQLATIPPTGKARRLTRVQ